MKPLVSIITVVYNGAQTIERTIKSVLTQTYQNIEYIIIDGGSTDGTLDVIKRHRDRLAYFVSEPDNGIYDAMNKGIQKATGAVIGLLNADDWYEPQAIETVAREYERTNAQVIVGETWVVDKNGNKRIRGNKPFSELWRGMCVCHQAVFVSKSAHDTFGLYDTRYKITADYELLLRMYHGGASVSLIDDVLVNYSATGISATSFIECAQDFNAAIQKYVKKYPGKETLIHELCEGRLRAAKFRYMLENHPTQLNAVLQKYGIIPGENCVVWGTGVWGQKIHDVLLQNGVTIPFFVDSNSEKWSDAFNGLPVKNPAVLHTHEDTVFIAVKEYGIDIANQLKKMENPHLNWILLSDFVAEIADEYMQIIPIEHDATKIARNRRGGVRKYSVIHFPAISTNAASFYKEAA